MPNRVLIVDDDQETHVILKNILIGAGYVVLEADNGEQGIDIAILEQPDLVIVDIHMSGVTGADVCQKLRSDPKNFFGIIMLTTSDEQDLEALGSGADDYIVKPFNEKALPAQIKKVLATAERRKEASLDPLTKVLNRRTFITFLAQEEGRAIRYGRPLAVIMIDIDNFKQINDSYGRDAGDDILVEVASVLRKCCRQSDLLARVEGDDFIMLLPETTVENTIGCAEKARKQIESYIFPHELRLTASFGVSELRKNDHAGMLHRAAKALTEAKETGRNKVAVDTPVGTKDRPVSLLVIDDDEAIRDLIRVKMLSRGYDVQVAGGGDEAIDILHEHDIDLVLIDQEMPGRDGMSTYLSIKNDWPKLPAIMITAHGSKHLIKSFLISGGRDFIEKPIVDFESFDFRIKRVLSELHKEQEADDKLRDAKVVEESRKAKDVFLDSMSHELRTPLAHILKFAKRLQKSSSSDSAKKDLDAIEKIAAASQSLGRIVEDILEVTHIESNAQCDFESVHIESVLRRVSANVVKKIKEKKGALNILIPKDLPPVKADPQKLVEVFEKLICNSLNYATREGVSVDARVVPDEIIVSISDKGKGIPQERIPYLFEPFGTFGNKLGAKPTTDLGLYKSRRLVELMGGRIWVNSDENRGTTFFFTLQQDTEQ